MKDVAIIISILVLIVMGNYLIDRYLKETTDELVQSLTKLKEEVINTSKTGDRKSIKNHMQGIEENWNKINEVWAIFVMHQEVDNIEQALIKAKSMINEGNIEDAIPEIETAIFFVEHVEQREKLMLKNIF